MAKQYVINQTRQLIDLNDNLINFKISFRVAVAPQSNSASVPVFDVAVVEQSTINSNMDNIQYNHVTVGEFSGDIENANNVYQSWYLILKAPQEISVWVDIQKEEIAPAVPDTTNLPSQIVSQPQSSYNWTAIILLVLILAGGGWWYFYGRKNEEDEDVDKKSTSSSKSPTSKHSKASKASTSSDSDNHSTFAMSPTSVKILERIRK